MWYNTKMYHNGLICVRAEIQQCRKVQIFLNKYLAGQITLSAAATLNADCNASGNLDETDTTILMAFVLMKITDLPHIEG